MRKKYLEHIRLVPQDEHEWEFEFPRVGNDELEELGEGIDAIASFPRGKSPPELGNLGTILNWEA